MSMRAQSAAKRDRPVGICPRCGTPTRSFDQLGKKCGKPLPYGAKCPGVIRSALSADEWIECPSCAATGFVGDAPCPRCKGEGWLPDRLDLA